MIPPRWFNGAYRIWGCPETDQVLALAMPALTDALGDHCLLANGQCTEDMRNIEARLAAVEDRHEAPALADQIEAEAERIVARGE